METGYFVESIDTQTPDGVRATRWMAAIGALLLLPTAGCSSGDGGSTDSNPGGSSANDTGSILQDTGRTARDTDPTRDAEDGGVMVSDNGSVSETDLASISVVC